MKSKYKKTYLPLVGMFLLSAFVFLCGRAVGSVGAYLTDTEDTLVNKYTMALDVSSKVVEKYPYDTPTIDTSHFLISFEKAVQVANDGAVDEYVRVRLDLTDEDIKSKTSFSWDGTNYYAVDDYKNHLPDGWTYNEADGFYYYTPIVYAGGWDDLKAHFTYNSATGHYEYPAAQEILSGSSITVPLIRYVKTQFADAKDMRSYGLNVYDESCPAYLGSDHASAWKAYTN